MAGKLHFKTKAGYQKWLSYGHIHGDFANVKGNKEIYIAGKKHNVDHVLGTNVGKLMMKNKRNIFDMVKI